MNKKNLLLLACTAIGATAEAVPTVAYVKEINIGTLATAPVGIAYANNALYVSAFTNRRIIKIDDPLGVTPTVTTLQDLSAAITWGASRGPQGMAIDPVTSKVVCIGDDGTNGNFFLTDQSGGLLTTVVATTNRICSGSYWGPDPDMVVGRSNSSPLQDIANPSGGSVVSESLSPAPAAGVGSAIRDIAVVGNSVYYARNVTTNDQVGKVVGGTAGAFTSYAGGVSVYDTGTTSSAPYLGLAKYTEAGVPYIIFTNIAAPGSLTFIDTTNDSMALNYTQASLNTGIRDADVGVIGGNTYIFVTRSSGTNPNTVQIYQITSASPSSVSDWAMY